MTCKNCGAQLTSDICEYCGTKYHWIISNNDNNYTLEFNNMEYTVHLTQVDVIKETQEIIAKDKAIRQFVSKRRHRFIFEE